MSGAHQGTPDDLEQNLILVLELSNAQLGTTDERAQVSAFADGLDLGVQSIGSGELEGRELGDGQYVLSFSCPDADRLMEELRALVRRSRHGDGAHFVRMIKSETGRMERRVLPI